MNSKLSVCVAVAAGLWGCSTACTDIGCRTGFEWSMDSPLSGIELEKSEIELCHNDDCVRGKTLTGLPQASTWSGNEFQAEHGGVEVSVHRDSTGQNEIRVDWWLPGDEAQSGDVYRLTLFDAEGAVVHESMETVDKYESFYPNGKECGGGCKSASVDSRANPND